MIIRFLLDENIPYAFIKLLEENDFMVEHLKKMGKAGIKNGDVYKLAEKKESWIITRDADFENYLKFDSYDIKGIILFKLNITNTNYLLKIMEKFLANYKEKLSMKHLIIIEDDSIRIY